MIGWSPCNQECKCRDEDQCHKAPKNQKSKEPEWFKYYTKTELFNYVLSNTCPTCGRG